MKTIKMSSRIPMPFVFLFTALLLLAACSKSDKTYAPPVIESLSVAAAKPGDTIIIKGSNFSETATENTVTFNGVEGAVVNATTNKLVVIVPAGATTGTVTITVHGNKTDAGTLIISPLTLYAIKETNNAGTYTDELVAINPGTAAVTTIVNLSTLPNNVTMGNLVYLPATNELAGIDYSGTKFVKINVSTKQTSSFTISSDSNTPFEGLVFDKDKNLYSVKSERNGLDATWTITMIDPATGATTPVTAFKKSLIGFTYIPATNELVGTSGTLLQKYNLTTKQQSTVTIAATGTVNYEDLVVDGQSNLYGFKVFMGAETYSQIVKLDAATGAESLLTTLDAQEPIWNMLFVPQLNQIISFWEGTSLYKYSFYTNASSTTLLTTNANVLFFSLTSN